MTKATPVTNRLSRLAPLALLVLLAASCGDDNKSSKQAPTTAPSATTTNDNGPTGYGGKAVRGKNTLIMGKRNLYPLLDSNLQRFTPTQVNGNATRVVALAGPVSFWAGRSRSESILVKIRVKSGKAPTVRVGQKATFVGLLTGTSSKRAGELGVTDSAGVKRLSTEGAYVDVSVFDLKLR